MMSLIFCTKKVPTDQIPLPFCTAKDEINLQNTREKKNVYEFFKNIWRNLQGIILKKKKTTLVSTLADLLPWPWAYPLLEAETQARVCDILLPWYPAQSSVYSGKGRESPVWVGDKALSPHLPWACPERTRRPPAQDKGQAFPHSRNSLLWSLEATRTSDFQPPPAEFPANREREHRWGSTRRLQDAAGGQGGQRQAGSPGGSDLRPGAKCV